MKIKARDLQVGDILEPTKRVVTTAPTAGISTPTDKVFLGLDGKAVQFWKNTQVRIADR